MDSQPTRENAPDPPQRDDDGVPGSRGDEFIISDGYLIPRTFDGLRLHTRIGKGGFGIVFSGEKSLPRQMVAIKILRPDQVTKWRLSQFKQESGRLALLTHPNIVRVLTEGEVHVDGLVLPYFVTELIQRPLAINVFVFEHDLDEPARIRLIIKIAYAIQNMHDLGLRHRDLKPGNVLVGSDGQPKLIDLGLALTGHPDQHAQEFGMSPGTPDYMAPEQIGGGTADITDRTDVYALGVMTHELLTGHLPYDLHKRSPEEKKHIIRTTRPTLPSKYRQLQHPRIDAVVARALEKDTTPGGKPKRWETARQFAEQLEEALKPTESAAAGWAPPTPTNPSILGRFLSRSRTVALAATLAILSGYLGDGIARLTLLDKVYERVLFSSPLPAVANVRLEHVAIIRFKDEDEPARIAAYLNVEGFSPTNSDTNRGLHACLMERLVDCEAVALVFDIIFSRKNTPFDDRMGKAAATLASRPNPIPVFAGLNSWQIDAADIPIDKALIPHFGWGGTTMDVDDISRAWRAEVALQRGQHHAWPGLAAVALAPKFEAKRDCLLFIDASQPALQLQASERIPQGSDLPRAFLEPRRFPLTEVVSQQPSEFDTREYGVRRGDLCGNILLAIPNDNIIERATYYYEDIIKTPSDDLEKLFRGKIVFIANTTVNSRSETNSEDFFPTPDGRTLWGVYGHALAMESLLTGRTVRHPSTPLFWMVVTAAGVAGWLLGFFTRRSEQRAGARRIIIRRGLTVVLGLAILCVLTLFCLSTTRSTLLYILPFSPAFAFVVLASYGYLGIDRFIRARRHFAR